MDQVRDNTPVYITAGVSGGLFFALFVIVIFTYWQLSRLMKRFEKLQQKDNNVYHYLSPTIQPDEELSKRGFSMYTGDNVDVEGAQRSSRRSSNSEDNRYSISNVVFAHERQNRDTEREQSSSSSSSNGRDQNSTSNLVFAHDRY
ncbi:uncharacterized protein LOC126183720 isoform X1 [Schistocerca cancellata]|uniref:uncharacterized protein LOC126183720 isoform X1 n=1 Tax=Schistocerca cancellata TaxID=274614 RepID=UPI002118DA0F|nr:uncharacterized protein LOC126183720 isoform X1 [Schistocerca cancellata]